LSEAHFSFSNLQTLFKQRMKLLLPNRFRLLVFLFLSIAASAFALHKFYVSKTIIEYNARTQLFEITTKIFTDDLDKSLSHFAGKEIRVGTPHEDANANAYLEEYMRQHFMLEIDGVKTDWRWVGKEAENDLTFCYMEIYRSPDFNSLKLHNDLLVSEFPEQQNIVDLSLSGSTQTLVFFKDKLTQIFQR